MDFKDLLLFGVGAILFIWVIVGLNNFIGGNSMLMYMGAPAVFGILAIVGGSFFTIFVYSNYAKNP